MSLFSLGQTFLTPDPRPGYVPHSSVLLSDPEIDHERLVLVSVSSYEDYKDHSCIISKGEHECSKDHDSVLEYRYAFVTSSETLHKNIESKKIRKKAPFTEELIERAHKGAEKTEFIPAECYWILHEQRLIT